MYLNINTGQSKQQEINIYDPSQRGSKSFNLSVERFCGSTGTPVNKEVQNLFVMFIHGNGNSIEGLESALCHPAVPFSERKSGSRLYAVFAVYHSQRMSQ
jgi:hypothetical protein